MQVGGRPSPRTDERRTGLELWKPFADEFDAEKLTLFRTDHWTVLVRKAGRPLMWLTL